MIKKYFIKLGGRKIIDKNRLIVDIGSGISPVTPFEKETLFLDLEKEATDYLKAKGLKAVNGDITNLPLKDNSADFILCSEVLEHVKDYNKGLEEIYRILKKGGYAIITVPTHMHYWKSDDDFVGHYRRFNPDKLQKEMKEKGFELLKREPIGSRVERYLTYYLVKIARTSVKKGEIKTNFIKVELFHILNMFLLQVIRLAYMFNTEKGSSISMFILKKV